MKKFAKKYHESITVENVLLAWREFLRGKKKRKDIAAFQCRLMDNIMSLHAELIGKTYLHAGYEAFSITDPKPRSIHKAKVRDRLLHHVLYNEIYSYFDRKFIHDSYSCRVSKGTHKAIHRFESFARTVSKNNTRTCWILKCDIRKFFASIDHVILFAILEKHIEDGDMRRLLGRVIDSFQTISRPNVGLPLGNLTSQLLVNIYMNEFDQYMKRDLKIQHYIRYADDFVILSGSKKELEDLVPVIRNFLQEKLKLELHPNKLFLKTLASGVDFLGWVHFPDHRVLRTATKRRMLKRAKVNPTKETINSYKGMLKHGNAHRLEKSLPISLEK
jgi:RNA-directed DNA polymerase